MKKLLTFLLITAMVLTCTICMTACGGSDKDKETAGLKMSKNSKTGKYTVYEYVVDDTNKDITSLNLAEVAGKDAEGKDIVIGKIATGAFSGNNNLKEIIVPNTVEEIQVGAFKNMNKLESITLPFIGTTANADAFLGETPSSGNKSTDAERTFAYLFGTEEYDFGTSITSNYGSGTATYYLPAFLKEVKVSPANDYSIPMYAFSGVGLIEKVVLSDKVVAIGDNAFSNCFNLTNIEIPKSVKYIYNGAFKDCENLKDGGLVFANDSVLETIGDNAFECTNITTFVLPNTVSKIGEYCFANGKIKKFTLSTGITEIGSYAFYNCASFDYRNDDTSKNSFLNYNGVDKGSINVGVNVFLNCFESN